MTSLLAMTGLVLLLAAGCSRQEERPARIVDIPTDGADESGRRAVITVTDSNWTKVIVRVGKAERFTDELQTRLIGGVEAEFLDREGRTNAVLTADSASIDDETGNMCASGYVVVYSARNRTRIQTDSVCYVKETGMLGSEAAVSISDTLRGRYISGRGFESDEALGNYTIYQVTGRAQGGVE